MSFEISQTAPFAWLFALTALAIVTGALLHGWNGWLAFKSRQIECGPYAADSANMRQASDCKAQEKDRGNDRAAARIELADLKERVRRLEAIANGVDP